MANPAQFPIDGKPGKDWKVTSYMGWRMHPVHKEKRHHNGTDIISKHEPCWIEAPYDASVIAIGNNPNGFGHSVTLRFDIKGKPYVSVFAHMQAGSIKVKNKTRIKAGTPLGKMGSTGISTGKHLHWELQAGKKWKWNSTGKGFIEPVAFFDALIKWEKTVATAPIEAKADDPVAPAPTHDDAGARAVAKPAKPATPAAPKARANVKQGSRGADVKHLQKKLGITADGIFGPKTKAAVVTFQTKHGIKADGSVEADTWKALG